MENAIRLNSLAINYHRKERERSRAGKAKLFRRSMGIISDIIGLSGHLILLLLQKLQVTSSYTYIRILEDIVKKIAGGCNAGAPAATSASH